MDSEPTQRPKKLMIVDDDAEMRTLLAEYFRRLGFEVAEKENGQAALQTVSNDNFDCFILDVAMPEMSGIELLKKMRERGITTPALFLTAHDLLDDKVAGFEAGADDYLAKPFSPRELEYRIEALLRRGQWLPRLRATASVLRLAISSWTSDGMKFRAPASASISRRSSFRFSNCSRLSPAARGHATICSIASGALSTKGTNATSIRTSIDCERSWKTIPRTLITY